MWLMSTWVLGGKVCRFLFYVQSAAKHVATFTLILVSIERYLAITHPLRARSFWTSFRVRLFLACIWITSLILALPTALIMVFELAFNLLILIYETPEYLEKYL